MKWVSDYKHPQNFAFEIIKEKLNSNDLPVVYYLYAHDPTGQHSIDDLQEKLDFSKEVAFEDFGVPLDSWRQVE